MPADTPSLTIWLVTTGEPLPCDGPHVRLYRTGMLAHHLAQRGHRVHWWSSNFNHHTKQFRFTADTCLELIPGLTLQLLRGRGYTRHVSLRRIADHRDVANDFAAKAAHQETPDVIVAAYPTIELANACVTFGLDHAIPVALDIRDLWPDLFAEVAPPGLRWLARLALRPYRQRAIHALRHCQALYAITESYLDWGFAMARRVRTSRDRVIPFAYPKQDVPEPASADPFLDRLGLTPAHDVICFFGTFGRQFDFETIIRAARLLPAHGLSQVRIVLCGEGESLAHYRESGRDLPGLVFPGWIDQIQIATLMAVAKAGLAPYHPNLNFAGHLPNKPVEYMSAGLPIITCLSGLLSQMVHELQIGFTYTVGDPMSLIRAIQDLHRHDGLPAMRLRCRQVFAERYAAEVVMESYHRAILDLAHSGKQQP